MTASVSRFFLEWLKKTHLRIGWWWQYLVNVVAPNRTASCIFCMCSYEYIFATAPSLVAFAFIACHVCHDHVHAKSLTHNVAVTCVVLLHWVSLLLGRQDTSTDFKVVWILKHPATTQSIFSYNTDARDASRQNFLWSSLHSQPIHAQLKPLPRAAPTVTAESSVNRSSLLLLLYCWAVAWWWRLGKMSWCAKNVKKILPSTSSPTRFWHLMICIGMR